MAGVIVAMALGATAVWAVAREDHPRPVLTTGGGGTDDTTDTPGGEDEQDGASAVDGPTLTVSALDVDPGDPLTVRGSGCGTPGSATPAGPTVGAWSVHVWLSPAAGTVDWDPAYADPIAVVTPAPDGSWSTTVSVPEWHTEYRLEAACFDEASPPHGFVYRHERVVVT